MIKIYNLLKLVKVYNLFVLLNHLVLLEDSNLPHVLLPILESLKLIMIQLESNKNYNSLLNLVIMLPINSTNSGKLSPLILNLMIMLIICSHPEILMELLIIYNHMLLITTIKINSMEHFIMKFRNNLEID
jgi:hypothetical protein